MTFTKGEYVVPTSSGYGQRSRGYGSVSYKETDELLITSQTTDYLNVRKNGGLVFRIAKSKVRPVLRPIGRVPDGGIEIDDPRIAWIFEDAGRMADRLNLCRDYDRLCDALGAPGRVRSFTIKISVADGIDITAKVDARSKRQAEQRVIQQFGQSKQLAIGADAG